MVAEGADELRRKALIEKMNALLAEQPEFWTDTPYMAYFNDMHVFYPHRLPR